MYMYIMAKTIMISNEIYSNLKKIKADRSFTETIKYLMEEKSYKKTGAGLRECLGLLKKDDKEYDKIMEELKPLYKKWTKRYV